MKGRKRRKRPPMPQQPPTQAQCTPQKKPRNPAFRSDLPATPANKRPRRLNDGENSICGVSKNGSPLKELPPDRANLLVNWFQYPSPFTDWCLHSIRNTSHRFVILAFEIDPPLALWLADWGKCLTSASRRKCGHARIIDSDRYGRGAARPDWVATTNIAGNPTRPKTIKDAWKQNS